jgi:hypothetical protein
MCRRCHTSMRSRLKSCGTAHTCACYSCPRICQPMPASPLAFPNRKQGRRCAPRQAHSTDRRHLCKGALRAEGDQLDLGAVYLQPRSGALGSLRRTLQSRVRCGALRALTLTQRNRRWLEPHSQHLLDASAGFAPHSHLLTFNGGPRSCIGWRFALAEIQVGALPFRIGAHATLRPASLPWWINLSSAHGLATPPLRHEVAWSFAPTSMVNSTSLDCR